MMVLKVIGSGLGRTGTKSLQTALNMLGFGPCHHMEEVFRKPESMALWIEAGAGRPNWEQIFEDYRSAVDLPTAAYWRQLADYYPDAKVIHTVRNPDAWFDSTQATIFNPNAPGGQAQGQQAAFFASFSGPWFSRKADRAFMIDYFVRHSEEVQAEIPPERLLVYQVGEGWERLCAFLGVPVPDELYPSENSRAEFIARAAAFQSGRPAGKPPSPRPR